MREKQPTTDAIPAPPYATNSRALARKQLYRPGLVLAAVLLLSPALVAVVCTGIAILVFHAIPIFVPFLLLLVLPCIPLTWILIVSVRTDAQSIGAARLLQPWHEIPWALIERGERRGLLVSLTSSDGGRLRFVPLFLRDGARLYRDMLVRLPSHTLGATMRADAQALLVEQVLPTADGGLTGSLRTHPRTRWQITSLAVGVVLGLATTACAVFYHSPVALLFAFCGYAVTGGTLWLFRWLLHTVTISNEGVSVAKGLRGKSQHMAWSDIGLIEFTPRERVVRLRGDRRLVCAGPGLLRPSDQELMRAFLHAYCLSRGVPLARRRWLV